VMSSSLLAGDLVQAGDRLRRQGADLRRSHGRLGLAKAAAFSALTWPGRAARLPGNGPQPAATRIPRRMPRLGARPSAMSSKPFRYSSRYRSRGARLPRSICGIIFTRPKWAATSSPVSLAALRSSRAIRGTSQPSDSRATSATSGWSHRSPHASSRTRGTAGPLARSDSLRFAPPVSGCHGMSVQFELAGGGGAQGTVSKGPVRPRRSRTAHATRLDSSRPASSEIRPQRGGRRLRPGPGPSSRRDHVTVPRHHHD
jgi:hypothetical protein